MTVPRPGMLAFPGLLVLCLLSPLVGTSAVAVLALCGPRAVRPGARRALLVMAAVFAVLCVGTALVVLSTLARPA